MSELAIEPAAGDEQPELPVGAAGSDEVLQEELQPEAAADQPEPAQDEGKDWEAEATKWKALARKHEATAKKTNAAAQKWAEWEESQKTEQQRLADRLAAAERERDEARQNHARMVAAAMHNIPASLIDRIGGTTEEEINESAEVLAAELEQMVAARVASLPPEPAAPSAPASMRPVESLTPGARPATDTPTDPNDLFRAAINSARR